LNLPVFFTGEHSSSHSSGVLAIALIVVESLDFVDAWKGSSRYQRSRFHLPRERETIFVFETLKL